MKSLWWGPQCTCLFLFLLAVCTDVVNAQDKDPNHRPLMTPDWEMLGTVMTAVIGAGERAPHDPAVLRQLEEVEGQTVLLPGYLIPINPTRDHDHFMLSILPVLQCQFCGQGDVPGMVEVVMKKGKSIRFGDERIAVTGEVRLTIDEKLGMLNVKLVEAEEI